MPCMEPVRLLLHTANRDAGSTPESPRWTLRPAYINVTALEVQACMLPGAYLVQCNETPMTGHVSGPGVPYWVCNTISGSMHVRPHPIPVVHQPPRPLGCISLTLLTPQGVVASGFMGEWALEVLVHRSA
jgi:hypothetical protein